MCSLLLPSYLRRFLSHGIEVEPSVRGLRLSAFVNEVWLICESAEVFFVLRMVGVV